MTSGPGDVSVVVLTRNSARTLERCLKSVVDEHPGEIIAKDYNSTDATLEILRRYRVKIIAEPSYEAGLGDARRIGVLAATCKYVMFVDSDVELTKGCISVMVDELEKKGWAGIQARLVSKESLSYWQNMDYWEDTVVKTSPVGPRRSVATAATIFRRDLILREQFDPNMVYAEDVDLCVRLVRGGNVVGISATAVAYHTFRRDFHSFVKGLVAAGRAYSALARKYGSVMFLLRPMWDAATYLMKSVATGRWNRLPYFVCIQVFVLIGMTTFRPARANVRKFNGTPDTPIVFSMIH